MKIDNVDIVVVANRHRKALILPYLTNIDHMVSYTPDYTLPDGFTPDVVGMVQPHCHTGVYRCFKGHQDAMKMSNSEYTFIFEDDAVPNEPDWTRFVELAKVLLNDFEMVSFHGREYTRALYAPYMTVDAAHSFLHIPEKKKEVVCVHGALAYMIRKDAMPKILECSYNGLPIDILLVSALKFCLLEKSPFIHDRSEGSLLDVL